MKEEPTPPKSDKQDVAYSITKAALSFIPYVGGAAVEIFQLVMAPPLERRREKWMAEVSEGLRRLENSNFIKLEDIQSNEVFITILSQATQAAIRNHDMDKLKALHNAVMNSACKIEIRDDLQVLFIRFIEELLPSHFMLLKFFIEHGGELANKKSYEDLYLEFTKLDLSSVNRDEFKYLCGELSDHGFLRISPDIEDFSDIYQGSSILWENTNDELPRVKVTEIGKEMFQFINRKEIV